MITKSLIEELENIIAQSYIGCDETTRFSKFKNILMVRSVRHDFFWPVVDRISRDNPQISISILGDNSDQKWLDDRNIDINQLFVHSGKINREVFDIHFNQLQEIDAICYITPSIYRQSYINVLDACSNLANSLEVPLFSFDRKDDAFIEILNGNNLISALKIAEVLIDQPNGLREEEKNLL